MLGKDIVNLKYYSKNSLIPIYFEVEDGIRLQRALDRERISGNGKYDEMCRRFLADKEDYSKEKIDFYKPLVVNNNGSIENTEAQLEDIFERKLEIKPKETRNL